MTIPHPKQERLAGTPDWSLVASINTLFNTMRFVQAWRKGLVDTVLFSTNFTLVHQDDPYQKIRVDAAETPIPLQAVPEHIMMNVAATCFAQHDELADRTFNGEERFNHPDSNIRDMLSVLYLVRSAFALNPSAPRWVIRTTFRGKLFKIPEIKLLLDTGNLHGTAGVVPKIGGWYGAVMLLRHSHKLISPETANFLKSWDLR